MDTSRILIDVFNAVKTSNRLPWVPYMANGRTSTDIVWLYDARTETGDGPAAALVRYNPGTRTKRHLHPGYELIFVLDGVLCNDTGIHPAGTLEICPPNSTHELWSEEGCTFLVVWEQPVAPVEALVAEKSVLTLAEPV